MKTNRSWVMTVHDDDGAVVVSTYASKSSAKAAGLAVRAAGGVAFVYDAASYAKFIAR
jgi:hypothetical protein